MWVRYVLKEFLQFFPCDYKMWKVGQKQMSAILKFDFQKKKTITFFWSKVSKLHKKRPNFACDNYIFPKTRGNKNKQWTHSTPLTGTSWHIDIVAMIRDHPHLAGVRDWHRKVTSTNIILLSHSARCKWIRIITPALKGCWMSRFDTVSLWYVSLLIITRFRFFILE